MLQDIRNSTQSTAAKIVVGLIVVTFALFGVESIVGGLSGEPEVATVNGEGVKESTYKRAVEGKRRQILTQMGERADPDLIDESLLGSSVLEGLIEEQVLAQDAQQKGLYVSELAVDDYIRSIEQFQVDGVFNNERMQFLLRNAGLTLKDYKASLIKQFVIGQPRSALIASAFVLDAEQQEIIALDRQQRTFGVATVFKRDYLDAIVVSEEEIQTYYDENKDTYKKPENVDVAYLELDKNKLMADIEVDDAAIEALYESEKLDFVGEEQRRAAHILIKIDDETDEAVALEKVTELKGLLDAGEDFAGLAKSHSQDEGSASSGGDLGMSPRGVYVSDFEDALFGLAVDEVSQPVKTEFGYHLIKLLEVDVNDIPELAELRPALEVRLKEQRANEMFADLSEQLADLSYSAPDLLEPAEELGLEVKELAGVSALSQDSIFSNTKVQRALFSEELLKEELNSSVIEVEDGRAVVVRVNQYHPESILPLSAVKTRVRDALIASKSAQFAESVGQAFMARIQSGEEPESVSQDMGLNWQLYDAVKRDNIMVNDEVIGRVFAMEKPADGDVKVDGFEILGGDFAVVMLKAVQPGDKDAITAMEKRSIADMMSNSFGAGDYRNYKDVMMRQAEVERI